MWNYSVNGGCYGLAWMNARCPPKPLYQSPPQLDRGQKNMKGYWVEIRAGRDHSVITVMGKTD